MIRRLFAAYHWARAWDDELKFAPGAALHRIDRMEALRPLSCSAAAYKAWLLFHVGRREEADRLFAEVEERIGEPATPDQAYVQLFCKFYGRYRISRLDHADAPWDAAQELQCSATLRRYLPFYRKPSEVHADPLFADLETSPLARRYRRNKRG